MELVPKGSGEVNYGYVFDQTIAQQGYGPAIGSSTTEQWPAHYSYDDPQYTPYRGNSVDYRFSTSATLTMDNSVPLSTYSSLLPSSCSDISGAKGRFQVWPTEKTTSVHCDGFAAAQEKSVEVDVVGYDVVVPATSELVAGPDVEAREASFDGVSVARTVSEAEGSSVLGKQEGDAVENSKNLKQRKVYFQAVSDDVGFTITDPDTITSHEKKRCYLETLEEYVLWLHEQIRRIGQEPLPLERISTYRGLKTRSARIVLVHMQDEVRQLNAQKLQAEEKFIALRNALLGRQAAEEAQSLGQRTDVMDTMPHGMVSDYGLGSM